MAPITPPFGFPRPITAGAALPGRSESAIDGDSERTSDDAPRARWSPGPGLLVTAAFVGPGTIATASSAGASFAYALVWALVFSVVATIVLQEMSVRSAIVTGRGLAATLREALGGSWPGRAALLLVILAIGLGNAAYESGNIAGAALALAAVSPASVATWSVVLGLAAGGLLFLPAYRLLEKVLIGLVLLMSAVFVVSALVLVPDFAALARGLAPTIPAGATTTVIALIGTTVVPYNLFLQANAARDHWRAESNRSRALGAARTDTFVSVTIGGIITLAIVSVAATSALGRNGFSAEQLVQQLEPVLGPAGRYLFAAGLWAAGLTSAVTAPLAAAYAVCGALGLDDTLRGRAFRLIALAVVATGTVFAATGARPLSLILLAQAANGLLLPVIALILLWMMNQRRVVGDAANGWSSNLLAGVVVVIACGLGAGKLLSLFGG